MIIKRALFVSAVLSISAFAEGPSYTGNIKDKPSTVEQHVNDEMSKTSKKIEIESQKKEVQLKKEAPKDLRVDPPPKRKTPFIVDPKKPYKSDPSVLRDQYDQNLGKDPSTEFEQEIIEQRNPPADSGMSKEEFIRQFKENAAKAGVKVEVDPNTMKAKPVHNNGSN